MRSILIVAALLSLAHSLTITMNHGREDGKTFAVVNVRNNHPFSCQHRSDPDLDSGFVECKVEGNPQSGFSAIRSDLARVSYEMKDEERDGVKTRYMVVYVRPLNKLNVRLFTTFSNLRAEEHLPVNKPSGSVSYQVVVFEGDIPFLSKDKPVNIDSVNFPVTVTEGGAPQLPEMDVGSKPLNYETEKDLSAFLEIKEHMKQKRYKNALAKISDTLQKHPSSLFGKDMMYYAIVASSHIDEKRSGDFLIDRAKQWIRAYSNDERVPEITYLLANAYKAKGKLKEAHYFYNKNADSYRGSRYAPLSKMQIAHSLTFGNDIAKAPSLYRDAYRNAKDIDSASEIALNWAVHNLKTNNLNSGLALIKKVMSVSPESFVTKKKVSKALIRELQNVKAFNEAGVIARYISKNVPKQTREHRDMLYLASDMLFRAEDFDEAHVANQEFLEAYPDSEMAQELKRQDDAMLFNMKGDDSEKIARYEHVISKNPGTKYAEKALSLKAELLMKLGRYGDVLEMEGITDDTYIRALIKQSNALVDSGDCGKLSHLLVEQRVADKNEDVRRKWSVGMGIDNSLHAFMCLNQTKRHVDADRLFSGLISQIDNAEQQLRWLYMQSKNLISLGRYADGIQAGYDTISLAFSMGKKPYNDVSFDMFNAMLATEPNQAISLSDKMREWFPKDARMLPVHFAVLEIAQKNEHHLRVKDEVAQLMGLQNETGIYNYSPHVNFVHIGLLVDEKRYEEAQKQLDVVEKMQLNDEDLQQLLYRRASIFYSTGKDNKELLEKCVSIDGDAPWKSLCRNALELHSDLDSGNLGNAGGEQIK